MRRRSFRGTNRCHVCGKFKPWEELILHFVPDSECSSEDESWRECDDCLERQSHHEAQEIQARWG